MSGATIGLSGQIHFKVNYPSDWLCRHGNHNAYFYYGNNRHSNSTMSGSLNRIGKYIDEGIGVTDIPLSELEKFIDFFFLTSTPISN